MHRESWTPRRRCIFVRMFSVIKCIYFREVKIYKGERGSGARRVSGAGMADSNIASARHYRPVSRFRRVSLRCVCFCFIFWGKGVGILCHKLLLLPQGWLLEEFWGGGERIYFYLKINGRFLLESLRSLG